MLDLYEFVDCVVSHAGLKEKGDYKILDYDLDRIYLAVNGNENNYTIRTWDIREDYIRYSVFENLENCGREIVSCQVYTGL